ncbi:hypothetical protein [Nocardia terpenica]|uniref:Uncharacterized protein n=1 Tax=Nocardia terpenica TaxID=455432 RepID=A0A6G9ZBS7_9NOCA|nr:hypothetical protein [Nocardia terpenica]QIS22606.1 hypothetical protein F6W96_33990 [Nocardia terpenica]
MDTTANSYDTQSESAAAVFHLEYLYGPQWRAVMALVERAAQLTADERERLNSHAAQQMQAGLSSLANTSGDGGLAGLLAGLGGGAKSETARAPMQIAAEAAKQFGRSRNLQTAGLVVGQAVSPTGSSADLSTVLQSLGSIGTLTAVSQAATATVLCDLIGQGGFEQSVYDELMAPWNSVIS